MSSSTAAAAPPATPAAAAAAAAAAPPPATPAAVGPAAMPATPAATATESKGEAASFSSSSSLTSLEELARDDVGDARAEAAAIQRTCQKGWLTTVIRPDGIMQSDAVMDHLERLACRMGRLVTTASLLHKYIIIELFQNFPEPHLTRRGVSPVNLQLNRLVGTPAQEGILFHCCLSYLAGVKALPGAQGDQRREAYALERCWERILNVINGLTKYKSALDECKKLKGARRQEAAALVQAVRSYKSLLNRRQLFDENSGRPSAATMQLRTIPAIRDMDDQVRPLIRQYALTSDEVGNQLSEKSHKSLTVQDAIQRLPGHHFALLLAVHKIRDQDVDAFPTGFQCVPIRRSAVPKFFTLKASITRV
ncbi:hypothetical protein OC842_006840 [Tilletia horrida]|uniref:Uncharacterized protein n=1 Tax=Tilletia horrida TaxID=155126 RepID=A0AAN6JN05_9BASI|nr:hypothetical protein OC842_006840 [Tilletia horrida]